MPELAEVEYFRKQWDPALGMRILEVHLHPEKRVFRETDPEALKSELSGRVFKESRAAAKQMLFRFEGQRPKGGPSGWMGVHLGMAGKLFAQRLPYAPGKHDHLTLKTDTHALVFQDYRLFGKILFEVGKAEPAYWRALPPDLLSPQFKRADLEAFLRRRAKAPLKALLLDQSRFPGIGNWMADEILWQAGIHPARKGGDLEEAEVKKLYQKIRYVCRGALKYVGNDFSDPPRTWLFQHRWKDGGVCPKTKGPLLRETIGGRTTCYSPSRQV